MSQKMDLLQQLQSHSLEEVTAYKAEALKRKAELDTLKAKGGKAWTPVLQEELEDVALFLAGLDNAIKEKAWAASIGEETATAIATDIAKAPSYTPAPGTEKMVHLSLVQGRRFNPLTGKEESQIFTQLFTFAEWQLFKKNYRNLGYTVMAALHDPYGDAAEIVTKTN